MWSNEYISWVQIQNNTNITNNEKPKINFKHKVYVIYNINCSLDNSTVYYQNGNNK